MAVVRLSVWRFIVLGGRLFAFYTSAFWKHVSRMSLADKTAEIQRLIDAFEVEAGKFHDLQFTLCHITQDWVSLNRKFSQQNHAVMLWQYYGPLEGKDQAERLMTDLKES